MATKNWTEAEIKSLIKDTIKQELKDIRKSMESLEKDHKKFSDEEKVKEIVRDTLVNMYKFLWQKSNTYIRHI